MRIKLNSTEEVLEVVYINFEEKVYIIKEPIIEPISNHIFNNIDQIPFEDATFILESLGTSGMKMNL